MAEAVLRSGVHGSYTRVESAGVRASPRGEPADARGAAALLRRGYELGRRWRSRRVTVQDFERFDLVLAMDHDNLRELQALCPAELRHRIHLFLDFVPAHRGQEVPDPYFGSPQGFEHVLNLLELGAEGLAQALSRQPA